MCYSKKEYNDEPVYYCSNPSCLSLSIKELTNSGMHVCLECGTASQKTGSYDEWNELYIKEHGKPFLSSEDSKELSE